MRGRVNAIRTFKGLVADLRIDKVLHGFFQSSFMECPYDDDDSIKDYNYIIQELSYNG